MIESWTDRTTYMAKGMETTNVINSSNRKS